MITNITHKKILLLKPQIKFPNKYLDHLNTAQSKLHNKLAFILTTSEQDANDAAKLNTVQSTTNAGA